MDDPIMLRDGHIRILALCEATRLVLFPNVLYTFEVVPGCPSCESLAADAAESDRILFGDNR